VDRDSGQSGIAANAALPVVITRNGVSEDLCETDRTAPHNTAYSQKPYTPIQWSREVGPQPHVLTWAVSGALAQISFPDKQNVGFHKSRFINNL